MNFQYDIPSIPIDNFTDHWVLVFDLTSIQEVAENFHYPELVEEPLRLELNFIFPLKHVLKSLCRENECLRLQLISLVLLKKVSEKDSVSLEQLIKFMPPLKNR